MAMPKQKWKAGQVDCAIWENEINVGGETKTILKASIGRRYKDSNGVWKTSTSFSRNEIPLAVYCLEKAFAWIVEQNGDRDLVVEQEVIE